MKQFFLETTKILVEAVRGFIRHKAPRLGASLAFYTLLSLSPLLLLFLAILGYLFGDEAARGAITAQIQDLVGTEGARAIDALIANANHPSRSLLSTIIGVGVLLIGASSVFVELKDALDDIWEIPKSSRSERGLGLRSLARDRILAFLLIGVIASLLLVSLVASAVFSAIGERLVTHPIVQSTWVDVISYGTSFLLTTGLFAMIFRLLPTRRTPWRHVVTGAVLTSWLFFIGKWLIGLYLGRAAVGSAYGAAGSLVVLLVWVYYSTQILLFGAEVTRILDQQSIRHDAGVDFGKTT
ncbi:YihY/virulence factor BrkB family protein [soil metagenome]